MKKPNHFFLLAVRHSFRHPVQSLLLILGVALGVAMIVAIDLSNQSASQAFSLSTDSIVGKATHQIVAAPGNLPTSLYTALKTDLGLSQIAPTVNGLVQLQEAENLPVQLLGVDPFAEPPFRNYLGDGPSLDILLNLLVEPNTVLVSKSLGERYHLTPGDTITLLAAGKVKTVTLAGLLQPEDELSKRALEGLILADISTAQEMLEMTDSISTIDLILPPEMDVQPILDHLPGNAQLQQTSMRNKTLTQLTAAFELNLSALSMLALIVGMFLIYNTISFSVVQRRPVLGTLRCLGVTRRELFGLVLIEALVLSAIGAFIGLGLGVLLGRMLVGLVTRTINDLFFTLTVQNVTISAWTLYKGFVAGLLTGLFAAFIPALEATTVSPNNALKRSVEESRLQNIIPTLTGVGIILMIGGWILLNYAVQSIAWSFIGIFFILMGAALLTPLLTQGLIKLFQPLIGQLFGIIGTMAPRDIIRALSRTSVTIAALMLAVTVIIGVSIMIDSFRSTVVVWLDSVLSADIYIRPAGQAVRADSDIDPTFVEQMQQHKDVAHISLLRAVTVFSPDQEEVEIRAFSPVPENVSQVRPMLWSMGSPEELNAALDQGSVIVSEVFARRFNLPLDAPSTMTLITERGETEFQIVGIFYDYAIPEVGYLLMRLQTYQRHWPSDQDISNVALYLKPESRSRSAAIARTLTDRFAAEYQLSISSNRTLKENALAVFDRTFTITTALRLLATIVAFIGVLSALMSLQLERTRELGTLRANGMTILQLWGKTLLETALMGLTAGLLALPMGWMLAYILIYFINLRSFGWSLRMQLNPTIFVMALVVAMVAALLAAIYPVLRLSRMKIAVAVRQE